MLIQWVGGCQLFGPRLDIGRMPRKIIRCYLLMGIHTMIYIVWHDDPFLIWKQSVFLARMPSSSHRKLETASVGSSVTTPGQYLHVFKILHTFHMYTLRFKSSLNLLIMNNNE